MLPAFNKIYSENQKQKTEHKDLKNLQFCQNKSMLKVVGKEGVVIKKRLLALKRSQVFWTGKKRKDAVVKGISEISKTPAFTGSKV